MIDLVVEMLVEMGYYFVSVLGQCILQVLYGELNVFVIKQLEFMLLDCEDYYSDFGSMNNVKVVFCYQLLKLVMFCGMVFMGFCVLMLVNLYLLQVFGVLINFVGLVCDQFVGICNVQGMQVMGGNLNLKFEKLKNYDFGIVLVLLFNFGIMLDYYYVMISDQIMMLMILMIYKNYNMFSNLYYLNVSGLFLIVGDYSCDVGILVFICGYIFWMIQNLGGVKMSGVDVSVNYMFNMFYGCFCMGLEGNWIMQYKFQVYQGVVWQSICNDYSVGYLFVLGW